MALNAPFVATNTAPTGAETTGVTRPIFRKNTIVETTTLLAAGAKFTGPWHDSQADGTIFVRAYSVSNQASSGAGITIQETDEIANATFIRTPGSGATVGANALGTTTGVIRARYWRVTYTNGATAQGSFELTTCAMNFFPSGGSPAGSVASDIQNISTPIITPFSAAQTADNSANNLELVAINGAFPLVVSPLVYGGAFSGTASAGRQGWSKPRTPTIFNTVQATASGNTAVWTPASNNKFRLLKYQVETTANAATTSGVVVTVGFQDATTDLNLTHDVFIPISGVTPASNQGYTSGWQDLGQFGILSAVANNVLNVNLSVALTAGNVRIRVCGTEE